MDPLQILLLQWQGINLNIKQVWDLLSLNEKQIIEYVSEQGMSISEDTFRKLHENFKLCHDNGIEIIPFWHPNYPKDILNMANPPWALTCVGDSSRLVHQSVAVVGSRKLNFEAAQWMESELSELISESGFDLVSGGAYGVDQKAHQICILHNRPSVCWLPSGLLNIYPSKMSQLAPDLLKAGGVFVSTYEPKQSIRKHHFYQRNQFIAASSLYTFIVQAKRRSGTLITAKAAADMGKTVAVLPSAPNQEGLGGLDLLHEGARLIRDSRDLIELANELMIEQASPFMKSEA